MPRDTSKRNTFGGEPVAPGISMTSGYQPGIVPSSELSLKSNPSNMSVKLTNSSSSSSCCGSCADGKACEGSKIMGMQPLLFIALVGGLVYMASR